MLIRILVVYKGGETGDRYSLPVYEAYPSKKPDLMGTGPTEEAAVGDMVLKHAKEFRLEVTKL